MVHIAYNSLEVLNNCPTKIDAVESYGPHLLVSCSDGSLRIYGPESFGYDQSLPSDCLSQILGLRKGPYVLERTVNCFSKKPIVAMEILVSRELLLSLSESIAFHSLPNLETIAVITKAKGANAYSWDDRRGFLCFAKQKRVCIFRHDGRRGFVEVKEFRIPDMVKSMSWCGENICLGHRREYTILNTTSGALSKVFPSGRIAPPLVVSLSSGELLLGKDNIGVFVDQNGKLLQEGRICWSEAPTTVVIQKPYAIALLSRHVEVRSLRIPHPLIQTIVLCNVRHLLQSNNVIIEALDNSVHGLFPVPLRAQIVQLTASGDFEEALVLCKLLPPEDSSLRTATEQSIHMRYAHHLFENGNYEEAMEHFLQSQVKITYVLSLYPSITLPKSSMVVETEKFMDITGGDASDLSRGSSCFSDDLEYLHPPPQKLESSGESSPSALESKKMSHNTLMAVIKFLQKKRFSIVDKATAEKTAEVVSDALGHHFVSRETNRPEKSTKGQVSIPVNWGAKEMVAILDTALLQGLLLTGQPLAALELLKGLNYCDIKICEDFLQKRSQYLCLLELYKCNDLHREALKLLHQLVEGSRSGNKQHPEIIQKFKPEMILEYLKPLCGEDPDLVLEFSMLVLEICPPQTIELFLSGNIATDKVNTHLKQHAPNMQATYLELMLAMDEKGISGNLQNEMVQIYLSEVLEWHENLSSQKKWDEKAYSPPRKKLLSALERISGYSPEDLLKRLPQNALYEERAILLGKMNEHKLALCIYVHKLHVPELALFYCDRVYESGLYQHSSKKPNNIYLTLLDIYLNPQTTTTTFENRTTNQVSSSQNTSIPNVNLRTTIKTKRVSLSKKIAEIQGAEHTQTSPSSTDSGRSDADADDHDKEEVSASMIDEALNLLSQRWDRIDGAQALKLLPGETTIQNLLPFLGPLMRKSTEAHRNFSVIKSLRESENLRVKDELYSQRKTVVKITGDSMCSRCNKKIGTSAFAVYPDSKTIVHFVCFRGSQKTKVVAQRSTFT